MHSLEQFFFLPNSVFQANHLNFRSAGYSPLRSFDISHLRFRLETLRQLKYFLHSCSPFFSLHVTWRQFLLNKLAPPLTYWTVCWLLVEFIVCCVPGICLFVCLFCSLTLYEYISCLQECLALHSCACHLFSFHCKGVKHKNHSLSLSIFPKLLVLLFSFLKKNSFLCKYCVYNCWLWHAHWVDRSVTGQKYKMQLWSSLCWLRKLKASSRGKGALKQAEMWCLGKTTLVQQTI